MRAFCTATSQLKASRRRPKRAEHSRRHARRIRIIDDRDEHLRRLATGRRMPARVLAARWAASVRMFVTSLAVNAPGPQVSRMRDHQYGRTEFAGHATEVQRGIMDGRRIRYVVGGTGAPIVPSGTVGSDFRRGVHVRQSNAVDRHLRARKCFRGANPFSPASATFSSMSCRCFVVI